MKPTSWLGQTVPLSASCSDSDKCHQKSKKNLNLHHGDVGSKYPYTGTWVCLGIDSVSLVTPWNSNNLSHLVKTCTKPPLIFLTHVMWHERHVRFLSAVLSMIQTTLSYYGSKWLHKTHQNLKLKPWDCSLSLAVSLIMSALCTGHSEIKLCKVLQLGDRSMKFKAKNL